jgi:hypothetical protein
MAGLIMLGLIALMVLTLIVMLFLRQGWKRILVAFVGFVVVIGLFNSYVMKTCLPNAKDVEIMTPQAEVITNYILKNGIPKSLAEIPDLPYRLENCERELLYKQYRKVGYIEEEFEEKNREGAKGEVLREKCEFRQDNRTYDVKIRFSAMYRNVYIESNNTSSSKNIFNSEILRKGKGNLVFYNKNTETKFTYYYKFNTEIYQWEYDPYGDKKYPHIFSTKDDGVCNPMRQ